MTRWEATYLGTQVAVAVASPEAYEILDEHGLTSWQSGGCAILAEALSRVLDGQVYGMVREDGVVDHVVAKAGSYYLDADGAYTSFEMREKHEAMEGVVTTLRKLAGRPVAGLVCPVGAVDALVELLEDAGVGA